MELFITLNEIIINNMLNLSPDLTFSNTSHIRKVVRSLDHIFHNFPPSINIVWSIAHKIFTFLSRAAQERTRPRIFRARRKTRDFSGHSKWKSDVFRVRNPPKTAVYRTLLRRFPLIPITYRACSLCQSHLGHMPFFRRFLSYIIVFCIRGFRVLQYMSVVVYENVLFLSAWLIFLLLRKIYIRKIRQSDDKNGSINHTAIVRVRFVLLIFSTIGYK